MAELCRCNCNNTCGVVAPPYAPFRRGQSLQALLFKESSLELAIKKPVDSLQQVNAFCLALILSHGILGLLETNYTQRGLRNRAFLLLTGKASNSNRLIFFLRYYFAKIFAFSLYASSVVVAIISPAAFVSSVIINEILTLPYPVGEEMDAIGQVSPFVLCLHGSTLNLT